MNRQRIQSQMRSININSNKMEITDDIRQILTCEECSELVSCGPVYMIHGTSAAICGRCSFQGEEEDNEEERKTRSRNLQYEALAKHFVFPCNNASNGCSVKMEFSPEKPNAHERHCSYRTFICPIVGTSSCDWIGSRNNLTQHCSQAHPGHMFQNPCTLPRPDITKSHLTNYLISAFNCLFLVQLKVCLKTGKFYHAVRMFGDAQLLDKFTYTMKIEAKSKALTDMGSVLEPGLMVLQEPTAICTSINNLLGVLNGRYEDTKFTLTINTSAAAPYDPIACHMFRTPYGQSPFSSYTHWHSTN